MKNRPGNPEDVIIFYGAASSIDEFMILKYGPDKMLTLLTEHKSGMNLDDAIEYVYGIDKLSLENDWRSYIGAPKYEPDLSEGSLYAAFAFVKARSLYIGGVRKISLGCVESTHVLHSAPGKMFDRY